MSPFWNKQQGEEDLLIEVSGPVRRFLRRVIRHPQDAEDATSLTMLKLIRRFREGVRPKSPVAYALRVAWSRAVEVRRPEGNEMPSGEPAFADPRSDSAQMAELRDWIQTGFDALEPDLRAILHLRHVEDLSYDEIAEVLEEPLGTVKRRLHQAREKFREALARTDGDRVSGLGLMMLPLLAGRSVPSWTALAGEKLAGGNPTGAIRVVRLALMKKTGLLAAAALLVVVTVVSWRVWSADRGGTSSRPVAESPSGRGSASGPALARGVIPTPFVDPDSPDAPRPIAGTVVDRHGREIAGARIIAYPDTITRFIDAATPPQAGPEVQATTSDEAGRFVLTPARSSAFLSVFIDEAAHRPRLTRFVRAGARITVPLDDGLTMTGRVIDAEGAAASGASVRFSAWIDRVRLSRTATTGQDGTYRLPGVTIANGDDGDSGPRAVAEFRAAGSAPELVTELPGADAAGLVHCDVVLRPTCTVSGLVRDAVTREAVSGATVTLWTRGVDRDIHGADGTPIAHPLRPWRLAETRTDSTGHYLLHDAQSFDEAPGAMRDGQSSLVPAAYVAVRAPGRPDLIRTYPGRTDRSDVVLDFDVPALGAIRGVVRDDLGMPMGSVEVRLVGGAPEPFLDPWLVPIGTPDELCRGVTTVTQADGTYSFDGVPVTPNGAATCRLAAIPREYRFGMDCGEGVAVVQAGAVAAASPIILPRLPSAVIVVRDTSGHAIWGAEVGFGTCLSDSPPTQHSGTVRTDRDGRAVIRKPPAVTGEGYRPFGVPILWSNVVATDGSPRDVRAYVRFRGMGKTLTPPFIPSVTSPPEVEVRLEPERVLNGKVVQTDGEPVPGATIVVSSTSFRLDESGSLMATSALETESGQLLEYAWTPTGPDGRFRATELPRGPYRVVAVSWINGGQLYSDPVDVTDVSQPVTIVTPILPDRDPQGAIEIEVRDRRSHAIVTNAVADVIDIPILAAASSLGPGRWLATGLPPGTWKVRVTAQGFLPVESPPLEVVNGQLLKRVIELDAGTVVTGFVELEGEAVRPLAQLRLTSPETGAVQTVPILSDGSFRASGLLARGRYLVRFDNRTLPGGKTTVWGMPRNALLTLGDDTTKPLRVQLVRAQEVRLTLRGTSIFFSREDHPLTEKQRAVAAKASLLFRSSDGSFVWRRQPISDKTTDFAVVPGEYLVRLDLDADRTDERELSVTLGDACQMTFEVGNGDEK